MVNLNKKGISPVIATILLLAITVIIAVGVYQFLNTYTQDTFDNISGDSTVDLAFANQISMYDINNTHLKLYFAKTSYPEQLNFREFIFSGPPGTINCNNDGDGFNITPDSINEFNITIDGSGNLCDSTEFIEGKYELLMVGEIPVTVKGIEYNR